MTKQDFINTVSKLAQADYKTSKILPSLTIAQAILESNWGKSKLTVNANALFGIKATKSWSGKAVNSKTFEYYDGNRSDIIDSFRAYDNWEHSIKDHGVFLQSDRYKAVVGETDYKKASKSIQQAGYATAPTYADVLIRLIEQHNLTQYDKLSSNQETKPENKKTLYKVEIYSFSQKESADKVKQAILLLGYHAETYQKEDGYFKVESFPYSTSSKAKDIQSGLKLMSGLYSEVKKIV